MQSQSKPCTDPRPAPRPSTATPVRPILPVSSLSLSVSFPSVVTDVLDNEDRCRVMDRRHLPIKLCLAPTVQTKNSSCSIEPRHDARYFSLVYGFITLRFRSRCDGYLLIRFSRDLIDNFNF